MEEIIDVLDESGKKVGKIATRKEVHQKGLWHGAIVAAILNDKNEILMQQRSFKKEKNAGICCWSYIFKTNTKFSHYKRD